MSLDHGVKDRTMMVEVGLVKMENTKVVLVELKTTTADQTMLINTRMELIEQKTTTLEQVEVMTTSSVDLVDREALEEKELNLRDHGVEHSEFMGGLCAMGTVCSQVASMALGTVNSWVASVDQEALEDKELRGHGMEHSEFMSSLCGRGMGHSKFMGGLCGMGHSMFTGGLHYSPPPTHPLKKTFRGNLNGHDVRGLWCGGRGGWRLT